jgi:DNA-binding transcriptional MerR regulator
MFPIRELSERAGVPTKTIRYYEEIGLLPRARRGSNGYRVYDERDVERLKFIRHSRGMDFALEDIAEIMAFREREELPCDFILSLVDEKLNEIEARIRELEHLRNHLMVMQEAGRRLPDDPTIRRCACRHIQNDFKDVANNEQE